ncbi:Plant/T7H20-70 protein [Quillaja saponaria]|uniref:Plant/T7H20-70 protein n=1 Tax=Quillaja saponaria TaxID=32244 RepID=A0AAD7PA01_QUISA|nr:Plant/T7H20-70 protein [Quillaja saponaria]
MERKQWRSASSFTAELFGATESSLSSSAEIFASMFPPPSKVGRGSSTSEGMVCLGKQASINQGTTVLTREDAACNTASRSRSSIFQERKTEPCHLSSSLYYGGQDIYSQSPNSNAPVLHLNVSLE